MSSTPTPFADLDKVTLYRVPTNVAIPAGWQYVYRDKYAMVSLCFATAAYPPEERVASGSYWTFEPVPAPLLPTKPGAVITDVVLWNGQTFAYACLTNPEGTKTRWFATRYGSNERTPMWLNEEDVCSFKIAFEGIGG